MAFYELWEMNFESTYNEALVPSEETYRKTVELQLNRISENWEKFTTNSFDLQYMNVEINLLRRSLHLDISELFDRVKQFVRKHRISDMPIFYFIDFFEEFFGNIDDYLIKKTEVDLSELCLFTNKR